MGGFMSSMLLLLQTDDPRGFWVNVLKFFLTDTEIEGAYDAASTWVITALVIAILGTGLMLLMKHLLKQRHPATFRGWSFLRAIGHSLLGLLPVFFILLGIYYTNLSFQMVLQMPGLFKGIFVAWLLYLCFEIAADWVIWRADWNPRNG
jgi:hypothetical protein